MTAANDLAVRRALEAAGVVFIDESGDGPVCAFASDQKRNRETDPRSAQRLYFPANDGLAPNRAVRRVCAQRAQSAARQRVGGMAAKIARPAKRSTTALCGTAETLDRRSSPDVTALQKSASRRFRRADVRASTLGEGSYPSIRRWARGRSTASYSPCRAQRWKR